MSHDHTTEMPLLPFCPTPGYPAGVLDGVAVASERARAAALAVTDARARAKAERTALAGEVRRAAARLVGTVSGFAHLVVDRRGVPYQTVWNALYSTHSAATLAVCVGVLDDILAGAIPRQNADEPVADEPVVDEVATAAPVTEETAAEDVDRRARP